MDLQNKQLGSYRLVSLVGKGGMAEVWLGNQLSLNREVAVKVIPTDSKDELRMTERFEREARSVAQLDHPAILPVIDYGSTDDYLYIVMPYIRGGSLLDRIRREQLSRAESLRIYEQILGGLSYAHRQGLIHRDLKPGNILLYNDGRAVIADFGVAKTINEDVSLTQTGIAVGSPEYMAPEQFMGQTSQRTDLYAMGVILYQLLTGRPLYSGTTSWEIAMRHINDPLPLPHPLIPPALEQFLTKVLQKRPEARFASAEEMEAALHQAVSTLSPEELAYRPTPSPKSTTSVKSDPAGTQLPTAPLYISNPSQTAVPSGVTSAPNSASIPAQVPVANSAVSSFQAGPASQPVTQPSAPAPRNKLLLPIIGAAVVIVLVVAALLFVLLGSNNTSTGSTNANNSTAAVAVDPTKPSFRVTLSPQSGTKVSGTAIITDEGNGKITVTLTMTGFEPGDHQSHIHQGNCVGQGPIIFPLNNLKAGPDGKATATTVVETSFANVTSGRFYVAAHNAPGSTTFFATCGDIQA